MTNHQKIKKRMVELCIKNNFTNRKLSRLSGVPLSTIGNIMYGRSKNPGIVTIFRLCNSMGVTMNEFFDGLDLSPTEKQDDDEQNAEGLND